MDSKTDINKGPASDGAENLSNVTVGRGQEIAVYEHIEKMTTVPISIPFSKKEKQRASTEEIQALLVDDAGLTDLRKKMDLLRGRYQHAVKTELINFCYASSSASGDDGLLNPEESNRSPDFIKMLMNIVEKDKQIAEIAVNMVEEIDLMEQAKLGYMSRREKEKDDEAALKQIWENHKKSRKEIAKLLEEEQTVLYPNKEYHFVPPAPFDEETDYVNDFEDEYEILPVPDPDDGGGCLEVQEEDEHVDAIVRVPLSLSEENNDDIVEPDSNDLIDNLENVFPVKEAVDLPDEEEEEEADEIIRRGMESILRRLGYEPEDMSTDVTDNLNLIRNKVLAVKGEIQILKGLNASIANK